MEKPRRFRKIIPKSRSLRILLAIALMLVGIRAVLPTIILGELNSFLKEVSPAVEAHIGDLDFSIIRGAYSLEDISVKFKKSQKEFLRVDDVDISMAWREIFRRRLAADIVVDGADFLLTRELTDYAKDTKNKNKETTKAVKEKIFKLDIVRIDLHNSSVQLAKDMNVPLSRRLRIENIEAQVSNLIVDEANPFTLYTLKGSALGSATIQIAGKAKTQTPLAWDADIEIKDFNLATANPFLKNHVPVTFTSGTLDLYAELKSEKKVIDGYAKPFIKKLDVVKNNENFVSPKHFGIELGSAVANLILRDNKKESVATRLRFRLANQKLDFNVQEAISSSIEHGFRQNIIPGIENSLNL